MDYYHIYCDLKTGVKDIDFTDGVHAWLGRLAEDGLIAGYRLTRRKLGLAHPSLPEWHIVLETEDLAQLDRAFQAAASRAAPYEGLHCAVNSKVESVFFGLYRDFPDAVRQRGEEEF